jgi:uncharacterized lipoprotein
MGFDNVRPDIRALAILVAAGSLLGGCSWFHRHSEKQANEYKTGVQERPLEVPPDLDKPSTAGALTIPEVGSPAAPVSTAPADASTAPAGAAAPVAAAPAAGEAAPPALLSADGLHVADSVDSTWNRVGLALERSGAATILARDEAQRTFDVQTTGQVVEKPGWFKKTITLGMAKGKTTAQVKLKLRVAAEGNGSKVTVEGASDEASQQAAQALLSTLKSRLS